MSTGKVLQALQSAGKPMKTVEISEAAGIDKKEDDKRMKALKKEGSVVSPKRCY